MFAWRRRLRPASGFPGPEMFKPVKIVTESSGGPRTMQSLSQSSRLG